MRVALIMVSQVCRESPGVSVCQTLGVAVVAIPMLLPAVRKQVALQVDHRGIFLGRPGGMFSPPSVLIPWDDVAKVVD
jgi:hypothetical protein